MDIQERIIGAVKKYEVLYNTSHTNYKKTQLKEEIWTEISKELNLKDGTTAKRIWLKLRNNHRDALRRQKVANKSGSADASVRPWKFQKKMEYLLPYMENRYNDYNFTDMSDSEDICFEIPEEEIKTSPKLRKRKQREEDSQLLREPIEKHNTRVEESENTSKNVDPNYTFFMSMYQSVQKMSPAAQLRIRNKLYKAVSEEEASALVAD